MAVLSNNKFHFGHRVLLGALLFLGAMSSSEALQNYMYVAKCACQTTSDFTNAAKAKASILGRSGTYMVTSTTKPETANILIIGSVVVKDGEPTWVLSSTYPIDANGNSLAGSAETYLETYYTTYDASIFGWLRGESNSALGKIAVPDTYQTSFVCNCEVEDMAGQVPTWIQQQYPGFNIGAMVAGTPVTVVFKDGSTAVFLRAAIGATSAFLWSGHATNSANKQIIDTHGTLANPPNPTATGGGLITGTPLPSGLPYTWTITGEDECGFTSSAYLPDGTTFESSGYGPC